jgi:hypothetical protein
MAGAVSLQGFVNRKLKLTAIPSPGTIAKPIRPWREDLSARSINEPVGCESVYEVDARIRKLPQAAADLGNGGHILSVADDELPAGWKRHIHHNSLP